jgi:hypothetical protein
MREIVLSDPSSRTKCDVGDNDEPSVREEDRRWRPSLQSGQEHEHVGHEQDSSDAP